MSNNGFRFKKFTVKHDKCGMKVGTDSIVLGSWCNVEGAKQLLDIGTGSGVLALMLAQKSAPHSFITAVDIEPNAVVQALENVENASFEQTIEVLTTDIKTFVPSHQFDIIICNPPYFVLKHKREFELNQNIDERQLARAQFKLTFTQLLDRVELLLTTQGKFYCVLPDKQVEQFVNFANVRGLFVNSQLIVKSNKLSSNLRRCLCLSRNQSELKSAELIIYDDNNQYTQAYRKLCQPYYLDF